jgi:hypothetical protein
MTDYYDGPRKGIASFQGSPHVYESEWDDLSGGDGTLFRLRIARHDELQQLLKDRLVIDERHFIRVRGDMRPVPGAAPGYKGWSRLEVKWSAVD